MNFKKLENRHDLRLPDWGPYTKKYMGISHLSDKKRGMRFDMSVFPEVFRRKVKLPNVLVESDYYPWEASTDLEYFSHRHEIEWKDKVYCDISFSKIDDNIRLMRCNCVNNTKLSQSLFIHMASHISFPQAGPFTYRDLETYDAVLPYGALWKDALDYDEMEFSEKRPNDSLQYDGLMRGEVLDSGFVNGRGIGKGFGKDSGDRLSYTFSADNEIKRASLYIRYRMECDNGRTQFRIKGSIDKDVLLEGGQDFTIRKIPIGKVENGEFSVEIVTGGGDPIQIDGFVIAPEAKGRGVSSKKKKNSYKPEIEKGPVQDSIVLKYNDIGDYYGIAWISEKAEVREYYHNELDVLLNYTVHEHLPPIFKGDGHFTDIVLGPVIIEPESEREMYAIVCSGSREDVRSAVEEFNIGEEKLYKLYSRERNRMFSFETENNEYLFSQERMAATLLTNVTYPIYIKKEHVRHNTPGRWWDSLYTWDSGFIGIGLAELDFQRAVDCLNAYMTEPDDEQSAFIHHGSPVPVQIFLFLELWNKYREKGFVEFFYPRLKRFYEFLIGESGSSTTRKLKSNILKTWDYFYNSGGWDDYPAQIYVREKNLQKTTAPIATTGICIRAAKILMMAADSLGLTDDIKKYRNDISIFSKAVQDFAWDEEAGYFGYVCHDEEGEPTGLLRDENGINYNMGLDGIYPLLGGICTPEQEEILLEKILSSKHLWSNIGISTVDMSAPYFSNDGYWNGAVWMPHQWFIWKTMFDIGRSDIAHRIALTGLKLWKKETDATYNCYEHFNIASERGGGWHHFGGLSTPVLCWFKSYFISGTITGGFETRIKSSSFNDDITEAECSISSFPDKEREFDIIICMNPDHKYEVICNGEKAEYSEFEKGALSIRLKSDNSTKNINIRKNKQTGNRREV